MKIIYLIVQALAFCVISIGKGLKFLVWDIPYYITLWITRRQYWEQRIMLFFLLPIYFTLMSVPLAWLALNQSVEHTGENILSILFGFIQVVIGCVAIGDAYSERKDSNKYIPVEDGDGHGGNRKYGKEVKWYSLKEEQEKRRQEIEKEKLAKEMEREKDPDYVDAMREIGGLPKPKAIFDDSFVQQARDEQEQELELRYLRMGISPGLAKLYARKRKGEKKW